MKESKVKTVFFGIWVIIAFLLIQVAVSLSISIPIGVKTFFETGADMEKYMEAYTAKATSGGLITLVSFLSTLVSAIAALIWYYFGYFKPKKAAGKVENPFPKLKNVYSIFYILTGAISTYCLAGLIQMVVSAMMPQADSFFQSVMGQTLGGSVVLGWLMAVLIAPINEELVVRGIILERSKRSFGIVGTIVLTALLFGLYHMNPIQGFYVLPMGIFWAYLGVKYNSVIIPIIGHVLNNSLAGFLGQYVDMETWWLILIIFVVSFAACFYCAKNNPVLIAKKEDNADVTENININEEG